MPGGRRWKIGNIEQCKFRNAGIDSGHSGNFRHLTDESFWRPPHRGEDVRESLPLVVGVAGLIKRTVRAYCQQQRRDAACHNQSDGNRLRPEAPQITQ